MIAKDTAHCSAALVCIEGCIRINFHPISVRWFPPLKLLHFSVLLEKKTEKNPSEHIIGLLASTHILALPNQGAFNTDPFNTAPCTWTPSCSAHLQQAHMPAVFPVACCISMLLVPLEPLHLECVDKLVVSRKHNRHHQPKKRMKAWISSLEKKTQPQDASNYRQKI
jgi:hypothetical protein